MDVWSLHDNINILVIQMINCMSKLEGKDYNGQPKGRTLKKTFI
jgi:hypothetical protein